jgi:hypothetical protein
VPAFSGAAATGIRRRVQTRVCRRLAGRKEVSPPVCRGIRESCSGRPLPVWRLCRNHHVVSRRSTVTERTDLAPRRMPRLKPNDLARLPSVGSGQRLTVNATTQKEKDSAGLSTRTRHRTGRHARTPHSSEWSNVDKPSYAAARAGRVPSAEDDVRRDLLEARCTVGRWSTSTTIRTMRSRVRNLSGALASCRWWRRSDHGRRFMVMGSYAELAARPE